MTADGRGIFCSHMGELAAKVAHGKAPDRDFSRMHSHRSGGAYFLCASFLRMGSWRELSDSLPQGSPAVLTRVDFPACQSMIVDLAIEGRLMRYALVKGSDICMVSDSLAKAERERAFFLSRYGQAVEIVAIEDGDEASARLQRQLAIRNPRDET